MTDREKILLDALIEITRYYQTFRELHHETPSAAIARARAVIRQFDKDRVNETK